MNSWIDWGALGKIIGIGLLAGAGLPALFAVGLRALTIGTPAVARAGDTASPPEAPLRPHPAGMLIAGLCFAMILGAIGWGIYLIVSGA